MAVADGWQIVDHPLSFVPYRVRVTEPQTMEIRAQSGDVFLISTNKWPLVCEATFWVSVLMKNGQPSGHRYVRAHLDNKDETLARVLMGVQDNPEVQVDHIGGHSTTLDNRDSNLRLVTSAENNRNRRMHNTNRSGVNGVFQQARGKTWVATVINHGVRKQIPFSFGKRSNRTEEQARDLAIACRQANDVLNNNTNGQRPKYSGDEVVVVED